MFCFIHSFSLHMHVFTATADPATTSSAMSATLTKGRCFCLAATISGGYHLLLKIEGASFERAQD